MDNNTDYRKYLESEFGHIRMELAAIKEQTTQTNSRVCHVEEDIVNLKIANVKHVIECPNITKFEKSGERLDKLEKVLEDAFFFIRHPNLFLAGIVVAVILLLGVLLDKNPFNIFGKKIIQTEQTQNNDKDITKQGTDTNLRK